MTKEIEQVLRKMAATAIGINGEFENSYVHKVLGLDNLITAYENIAYNLRRNRRKRFKRKNRVCPDDTVDVKALDMRLIEDGVKIAREILAGVYKPKTAHRVLIPKEDGGTRELEIFSAVDRFIQQAMLYVLNDKYECTFSANSHGFIKKRGVLSAVLQGKMFVNEGYGYAIHMDVFKCFDTINHNKLMEILLSDIEDGRFLILIRRFIKNDVFFEKKIYKVDKGVPQGSPISPVCANIYLSRLDNFLDERGYKYIRYADDITIFIKTKKMSRDIIEEIDAFLKNSLQIKLNQSKTYVCSVEKVDVLGFAYQKDIDKRTYDLCISDLKVKSLMKKINESFSDTSIEWKKAKELFNTYCHNFVYSICMGQVENKYSVIDNHLLLIINNFFWKQWENMGCKEYKAMMLGLDNKERKMIGNTNVVYWGKEHYDIVKSYLNKDFLENEGVFLFDTTHKEAIKKRKIKASLNESFLL